MSNSMLPDLRRGFAEEGLEEALTPIGKALDVVLQAMPHFELLANAGPREKWGNDLYPDSLSVTHSPIAQSDGHDAPGSIDELVPGVAAMVDDGVVGLEHAVGQPVVAHELPDAFDRVQLRACGGSGTMVMLDGTARRSEMCHPAWCLALPSAG